jgi:hypothetical protein
MALAITEAIPAVQDIQIVQKLEVTRLELDADRILQAFEVQGVKCLGLGFSDWRYVAGSRHVSEARQGATYKLYHHLIRWCNKQEWAFGEFRDAAEPPTRKHLFLRDEGRL